MTRNENTFMECPDNIDDTCDFAIIGIPYDEDSTQTRGKTLDATREIRCISVDLGYTSEDGDDLTQLKFGDLGDLVHVDSYTELKRVISHSVSNIYNINGTIVPIFLGGNHSITYPTFAAVRKHHTDEKVNFISFDAHLDCYDEWQSNKETHCTVVNKILEMENMNRDSVFVLGARDIDIPELNIALEKGLKYFTMKNYHDSEISYKKYITDFFEKHYKSTDNGKEKAYISIDIDVLDPSIAPGTGYAIPGGMTYRELFIGFKFLATKFEIIGFDVVEYAPNLDARNQMTGFLISKLITEFMVLIKKYDLEKK